MTLPKGWTKAKLGEVTLERVEQGEPGASAVPYIDIGSIDRDLKRVGQTQKVTGTNAPTRARQWVKPGDVLVSLTRPNLNAVAMVPPELDGAVASTGFDVLRPEGVLPEWVFNRVRSPEFVADVCEGVQGVVYPAIRPADVRRHDLPIPPAPEQRRIVDAIDSYLTRLDDAVASLERVQTKLKAYRASMLKAAVEGRLVPTEAALARTEKRDYEQAKVLLARMLKARRLGWEEGELAKLKTAGGTPKDDKWKANYEEPVAPDTSGLPELPEGWCWVSLDQLLAEPLANGKSVPDGDGFPVLRLTCIKSGLVDLAERKRGDWSNIDPQRFLVEADDFLIVRGNGSIHLVGRGGRVSAAPVGVAYPDTLIRARVAPAVLHPPLLARWWDSPPVRRHIERRAKTTAGIYKVNQADLGQTPIPLAPMLEQTR
jgi:type I restriction enzyme S subunit